MYDGTVAILRTIGGMIEPFPFLLIITTSLHQDSTLSHTFAQLMDEVTMHVTTTTTTTAAATKTFVPSIWGRLHEPKENYAGSSTWINFLHSFLSSNMPSLRLLASISCRITSIHVFFDLPCALLTCSNLIRSTRRTGTSVGLRHT